MRTVPIHDSLLRPQLLAGGERTLVLLNTILSAALIFGVGGLVGIVTGCVLGTTVHVMLVMFAKRDAQAFDTYRRHIHQQKYYPASASPRASHQIQH